MIRNFFILLLCAFGCAQVKPLTGGEKDTIPPNIIKSIPERFSTNTNNVLFLLAFLCIITTIQMTSSHLCVLQKRRCLWIS